MIARLWRGRVPAARAEEYRRYQEEVGPPGYRVIAGVRRIYMLGRAVEGLYEIAMLTFWDSLAAIRAFAGDPIDRARYYDRDFDFLLNPPEHVEHFDVLASASVADRAIEPERFVRLWRDAGPRSSHAEPRAHLTTLGNRGTYLLGRDLCSTYEVVTITFWDSVAPAGNVPPHGETFDVLAREVIASAE